MQRLKIASGRRRTLAVAGLGLLFANLLIFEAPAQTPTSTVAPATTPPTSTVNTPAAPKAESVTDTEYISVTIDANGKPMDVNVKEWYRVRSAKGKDAHIEDPGVLDKLKGLFGSRKPRVKDGMMTLDVGVSDIGHADVYFAGKPKGAPGSTWVTADGPKALPIGVKVRYYTGEPGSEEAAKQVNAREFASHHGPFKLVITVSNNTKKTEEVKFTDVATKKEVTGIAEVFTPFNVKIPDLVLPDADFDGIRTNGALGRKGNSSVINWNLYLAPPDYPADQNAIVEGRANGPDIPKIDVIAQPVYPEPVAEALTSAGTQFQKGRRSFYFDVLNLLRENLIALGGLFSVLDDSFANLALPLIGPEKGNRDSGSFTDANLLWGVWTIAKGTEQLQRAVQDLDYAVQLARDAMKGQIATTQTLRLLIGKSTDTGVFATSSPATPPCVPICTPTQLENFVLGRVDQLLGESIWANLKDMEYLLGGTDTATDPKPYLPEAPSSKITTNPGAAVVMSVIKLKIAILEHDMYCLVYENHENECSSILGLTNKPNAQGWDKFAFVKFPFGQIEIEKGLRSIEVEGTEQIQAALGNKIAPNSFIWGTKTIVEGVEGLVDSFHQLGATWRFIADSVQNFGIFGIETSRSILQLDINAIDIETAAKAAANKRALEAATFFGKPKGAQGQLVLAFSTDPEPVTSRTTRQKVITGVAVFSLLSVALAFARFRLFWL